MATSNQIAIIRPRSSGGAEVQIEMTALRCTLERAAEDFARTVGLKCYIQAKSLPGDFPLWVDFEIGTGERFTTFFKPE